jgi:Eukaryotic-type carbonic anhydrase
MLFQLTSGPNLPPNSTSSIFSSVLSSISLIPQPGAQTALPASADLSFTPFTSAVPSMSFFTYSGSLTTPPCSEGVTFLIATEPLAMPVDTFNAMKKVVKFNSRFAQNGLGQQNLLEVSRAGLNQVDAAAQQSAGEAGAGVPAQVGVDAAAAAAAVGMKPAMMVVHSPRAFRG